MFGQTYSLTSEHFLIHHSFLSCQEMENSSIDRYDVGALVSLIAKHAFKRVVLQFPDEELEHCVPVYDFVSANISDGTEIYVTADSTWGSSIDDVSAMHCDGDVLFYFGTDLSSSGSIPVAIVPPRKPIDIRHCISQIVSTIAGLKDEGSPAAQSIVMFYEPGFHKACITVAASLSTELGISTEVAALPQHADLTRWEPRTGQKISTETINNSQIVVGGLLVPASLLENKSTIIVYVGDKSEHIVNILLRVSENTVVHYSPHTTAQNNLTNNKETQPATSLSSIHVLKGTDSIEFRERYGGVLRVKDAQIIGIIVGSMGLTGELTKDLLHRLQTLIRAAHKKYYCFVMGRLNEAKLCNFPEVQYTTVAFVCIKN